MTSRITAQDHRTNASAPKKRNKYGVRMDKAGREARTIGGILFASKGEAKRYSELCLLQRAHKITDLGRQVPFRLTVHGEFIGTYVADFTYLLAGADWMTVEDFKGHRTAEYKLKKKLFEALYAPRKILETGASKSPTLRRGK